MLFCEKIFSVQQIREADAYTISEGNISSLELMERAATACVDWINSHVGFANRFAIICGLGNNGGDGFAIARLLSQIQEVVSIEVFILRVSERESPDFHENYIRLKRCPLVTVHEILPDSDLRIEQPFDFLIDAIIGSGLSAPITGWIKEIVEEINSLPIPVISIDIPSGLFADTPPLSIDTIAIKADYTLSFQFPKLSFLFPETESFVKKFQVLPIGLDERYINQTPTQNYFVTQEFAFSLLKKRKNFSHKGNFGHALIIAGSYGKMGAAVLAAKSCLRSGTGLLTVHVPAKGVEILQIAFPEAMLSIDSSEKMFSSLPENILLYGAIGVGPGIGREKDSQKALYQLIERTENPMILDADALNILSENREWLKKIPENSILTPHVKEFERLAGASFSSGFERLKAAKEFSAQHKLIIVLKGAYTAICNPNGDVYFNSNGNPGMATAGSGDVLTGIVTAFLSQGYSPLESAVLSVFIHGRAGDLAATTRGQAALIASDIIENLSKSIDN